MMHCILHKLGQLMLPTLHNHFTAIALDLIFVTKIYSRIIS